MRVIPLSRCFQSINSMDWITAVLAIPHFLMRNLGSKQLHVNSQAGGLMVSSLAGREREQRWRKKFLHHSTSSFLVPCSIFQITSHQFAGRRPNGMLTLGTRARTKTMAKKFLHHSTSSFLVPCSIFQITSCQLFNHQWGRWQQRERGRYFWQQLNYFSGLVAGFRLARTPTLDKYEERSSETTLRRGLLWKKQIFFRLFFKLS